MNSSEGPFFKGSTLTYRTETGFRDTLRPVFFYFWRDFGDLGLARLYTGWRS